MKNVNIEHWKERIFFSRDEVDLHRVVTYNDNIKNNRRCINKREKEEGSEY